MEAKENNLSLSPMDVYIRIFKEWHYVNYAIRTIFPGMDPLTFSYWNASINHVAVFYLKIWNIEYLDKPVR